MEIINSHFSGWENMAPRTEFTRDFCAGIGPLQLGVVLVFFPSKGYDPTETEI